MKQETYFGLWSDKDRQTVGKLLDSLGVDFYFTEYRTTEEILKDWCAWDSQSLTPYIGYDLWINSSDLEKVGSHIVEMFPERKFSRNEKTTKTS